MKHKRYIDLALKIAKTSEYPTYKHCAVLVKGNKILNIGINKNKTVGTKSIYHAKRDKGIHAELDVIDKYKYNKDILKDCILYVVGLGKQGQNINSCPCDECQQILNDYGIKKVFYLDVDNIKELKIV